MYFPNRLTEEILLDHPRWEVSLSDGTKAYHDESIPATPWQELKKYCDDNNLKVTDFTIAFRDISVSLPSNKPGYFFRKLDRQDMLSERTTNFFLAGYIDGDELIVKKYRVPEMELDETESRNIEDNKESII
jgi:hypothetical protein